MVLLLQHHLFLMDQKSRHRHLCSTPERDTISTYRWEDGYIGENEDLEDISDRQQSCRFGYDIRHRCSRVSILELDMLSYVHESGVID
jgi:hypothetical protein